ncbi:MFS transporter [Antribacter gilvus]|uniref:MFS transporter n=1 Tax=Antribacter gilvus TaxID=2304675 RepID=UPI00197F0B29|nr:MFS transporter [Antribacter gilvus]
MTVPPPAVVRRAALLAATVFLVTLCLRPAITAVGPVLPRIGADEGLGEGAMGLLGALPLLAFAVMSPLVHKLSARVGAERAVLGALVVLAAATLARSYTGPAGLWIGTAVIGCAIAVGNVLVPAIVKRDYAANVSRATGVYSAFLAGAAGVASAVSVPIADQAGWRPALAVWAVLAVVVAAAWLPRTLAAGPPPTAVAADSGPTVWRRPMAWWLTAFMGLQSTTFYFMVTWLPSVEASVGVDDRAAGLHMLLYQVVSIVSGLLVPLIMRGRNQVVAGVVASIPMLAAALGLLLAPGPVLVWVTLAGLGSGASLVVALSLLSLRGRSQAETTRLSGMAQSVGYLAAAVGPVVAGHLVERTGTWSAALTLLAAIAGTQVLVAVVAGRVPGQRPVTDRTPAPSAP